MRTRQELFLLDIIRMYVVLDYCTYVEICRINWISFTTLGGNHHIQTYTQTHMYVQTFVRMCV